MKKSLLIVITILMFSQVFSLTPLFGTSTTDVFLDVKSDTSVITAITNVNASATNEIGISNLDNRDTEKSIAVTSSLKLENTANRTLNKISVNNTPPGQDCGIACVEIASGAILDLLSGVCINDVTIYDFSTFTVSDLIDELSDLAIDEGYNNKTFNESLLELQNSILNSELMTLTLQGEIAKLLASSELEADEAAVLGSLNSCLQTVATNNGLSEDATVGGLLLELLDMVSEYVVEQDIGPLTIDEGLTEVSTYAIENGYDDYTVFDLMRYALTQDVSITIGDSDRAILNSISSCITSTCGNILDANYAGRDKKVTICEGETINLATLTTISGGTFSYSGAALSGSNFNTTGLAEGDYVITYTVSNGGTCPDDTATITVTVYIDNVETVCNVIDANYCRTDGFGYNFYWEEMQNGNASPSFSSDNDHKLKFTTFKDGTALITGSTRLGDCVMDVHVVLKDKKDWATWNADGGSFKVEGCSGAVKEDLSYYVIDNDKSYALALGGDCLGQGKFKITQRPDPNDPSTPSYGAHVGPGAALNDTNVGDEGLAAWGWMGPEGDERKWKMDFNFLLDCQVKTCEPIDTSNCEVSCIDRYSESVIGLLTGLTINNSNLFDFTSLNAIELIDMLSDFVEDEGYNNKTFYEGLAILEDSINNSDLNTLTIETGIAELLASSSLSAEDAAILNSLNSCFATVASNNGQPTDKTIGSLILECLDVVRDYIDFEGLGNFPIKQGLTIFKNKVIADGYDAYTFMDLFRYLLSQDADSSSNDGTILNSIYSCIVSSCESISSSNDAGADNSIEVCQGTTVDLNALTTVSGGTFSYSGINLSLTNFNTTGLSGNFEITYTVSNGGSCPDDTATITVNVIEDNIEKVCNVIDANYCRTDGFGYNFYWEEMQNGNASPSFSSDATHKLKFTTYHDGTALISGSTRLESCYVEVHVVLKEKKDWATWSAGGGNFKVEGCSQAEAADLSYYIIDGDKSYVEAVGGDCLEPGKFKITQRPDPNDPNTPHYGAHVGPGAALNDTNVGAEGLAAWGWMGPENDERKWKMDFNFLLACELKPGCDAPQVLACEIGPDIKNETCHDENDGSATVIASGGTAPYTYLWSNDETTMTAISLGAGENDVVVTDSKGATTSCSVTITEPDLTVDVNIKALLGGTYNLSTGLMNTHLNTSSLISIYSPYLNGTNEIPLDPIIFDATGANAIVDWVWIEIRDINLVDVIRGTSALIQADGDIVAKDGVSPLKIGVPPGIYHIMISHRNHLGVITANAINFTYCVNIDLDLTVDINLIYGKANGASHTGDNRIALYSGDCDGNGQIQNTDKVDLKKFIGQSGMLDADLDMNGQVQNSDVQNNLIPNLGKGFQNSASGKSSQKKTSKSETIDLKLYAKRNNK